MHRTLRPGLALPLAALFAIAPLAAGAPPSQASAELPAARTIVDRHIKEIGGREAILAQASTHARGTITLPMAGLTGTLEAFHAKPNKFLQRMTLPGIGDVEEGFDGTVGWSISPMTGPRLLEGTQLEKRRFEADFYEDLKTEGRYSAMTTIEKTTFQGSPAYKIRLLKKGGEEDFEFYDTETGLKIGSIATHDSPMGSMQGTTAWSDYKRFGILLQPATAKVSVMNTEMIMAITSVEYGNVDPSVFALPTKIRALLK
jgi:hypothetical protein